MSHMFRAAATAVAVVVVLGTAAPAAVAGSQHLNGAHAKTAKPDKGVNVAASDKGKGEAGKAERKTAQEERRIARRIARKSAFLTRVQGSDKPADLADPYTSLVGANVAGDVTELADLGVRAHEATTLDQLRAVPVDVRAVRPAAYHRIISQIRRATAMRAIAADTTDVLTLLDPALERLSSFDADTTRDELREVQQTLAAVADLLEAVVEEPSESDDPDLPEEVEDPNAGSETETP